MRSSLVAVVVAVTALGVAACGDEQAAEPAPAEAAPEQSAAATAPERERPAEARTAARRGTRIVLRGSDFGPMLFSAGRQAIYVFENDARNRSRCFGACARAWPPVFTRGRPRAGEGVRASLLGTIKRGDRRQVTYAGRPLYFYANEAPGEVRCHNVDLNGGFWWAVGADGRRRP